MNKEKDKPLDRAFLAAQALDRTADERAGYSKGYKAGQEAERLRTKKIIDEEIDDWKKEFDDSKRAIAIFALNNVKATLEKEPEKKEAK